MSHWSQQSQGIRQNGDNKTKTILRDKKFRVETLFPDGIPALAQIKPNATILQ